MSTLSRDSAERALRSGDLDAAIAAVQDHVRRAPAAADLRVFLFQLYCVGGQWPRALTQLDVLADLAADALSMVQTYREVIRCELVREEVFAGRRSPLVLGEPSEWLARLVEALGHDAANPVAAQAVRQRAFELAPPSTGTMDDEPFDWLADGDARVGPVCEAIINGRYYWVPFTRISGISIPAPADLRDVVWLPAQLHLTTGAETVALIPARYPGSHAAPDRALALGRRTDWRDVGDGQCIGLGQRVLATDRADRALLDIRQITFDPVQTPASTEGERDA